MHIKTNPKDKMSFNQLYNDYQTRFLNFANTYVRDWDVAEDIMYRANLQIPFLCNLTVPTFLSSLLYFH